MSKQGPRQRIMDAALELAAEGGYDALQVRAITQRASVSSRTIYSYFPSLDSLLIFAVAERAGEELYRHITRQPRRPTTAARRVERVVDELNVIMRANRTLTAALLRALLCGKPDVAPHVRNFSTITQAMFAAAVAEGEPDDSDLEIGAILESVWFAALIGWAIGADPDERMPTVMRQATKRVVPN